MSDTTTAPQTPTLDPGPGSWVAPGGFDHTGYVGLAILLMVLFLIIYLYAVFDRYSEHRGSTTPLRTTIPTMLTVGLAYDLLPPLEGVNFLLPLSLIVGALARDMVLWFKPQSGPEVIRVIETREVMAGGPTEADQNDTAATAGKGEDK
ncbi:hypothetical protein [Chachezhania antarctica]|uniref:hypothetical protein n=1 Tax=Chachezhania antarctica TaxID=2340860 RepID=UPI000EB35851|nr:hypothetical protein [Chachezhania antarctica]|tara:strand:+ start:2055 stop:2501 length:447 start_codon:yes stop_codon:yes gene_type:complete